MYTLNDNVNAKKITFVFTSSTSFNIFLKQFYLSSFFYSYIYFYSSTK